MAVFYKYQYTNKRKNIHPCLVHILEQRDKGTTSQTAAKKKHYLPCWGSVGSSCPTPFLWAPRSGHPPHWTRHWGTRRSERALHFVCARTTCTWHRPRWPQGRSAPTSRGWQGWQGGRASEETRSNTKNIQIFKTEDCVLKFTCEKM